MLSDSPKFIPFLGQINTKVGNLIVYMYISFGKMKKSQEASIKRSLLSKQKYKWRILHKSDFILAVLCKARVEVEDSTGVNCTIMWCIHCSRIYPDLNFTAGVYLLQDNKYFDKVTAWTKTVYSDNTFGYSLMKSYNVSTFNRGYIGEKVMQCWLTYYDKW